MRFLHTADLHIGRGLEQHSRADEQHAVLQEICNIAEREAIDLVLIAGDVFDSFIPPAWAEREFYHFVEEISAGGKRAVVVIAGNHDQPERLAAAAELAAHRGIYLLGYPGTAFAEQAAHGPVNLEEEGYVMHLRLANGERVHIAALPYLSEARLQELFVQDFADDASTAADYAACLRRYFQLFEGEFSADEANLVIAHLFVLGGMVSDSERPLAMQVGGSFSVGADVFPEGADYIALGHLHRPQHLRAACPCWYAGSPLAYSFSECDQTKSVIVGEVTVTDGMKHCTAQAVPLQAGRPLTRWNCPSYEDALKRAEDPLLREMWVEMRIELEAPLTGEQIAALRQAHPHITSIQPVYKQVGEEESAEREAELNILERFALFVKQNEGAEADEALLAAFSDLLNEEEEEV